jgi:hypothetical protein
MLAVVIDLFAVLAGSFEVAELEAQARCVDSKAAEGVTATALPCPPYVPLAGILRVIEPTVLGPLAMRSREDESAQPPKHSAELTRRLSDVRQF